MERLRLSPTAQFRAGSSIAAHQIFVRSPQKNDWCLEPAPWKDSLPRCGALLLCGKPPDRRPWAGRYDAHARPCRPRFACVDAIENASSLVTARMQVAEIDVRARVAKSGWPLRKLVPAGRVRSRRPQTSSTPETGDGQPSCALIRKRARLAAARFWISSIARCSVASSMAASSRLKCWRIARRAAAESCATSASTIAACSR